MEIQINPKKERKEKKEKKKKPSQTSTLGSEETEKKTGLHRWIRGLGMYCIVSYIIRDLGI